jgi:hypothetical protein
MEIQIASLFLEVILLEVPMTTGHGNPTVWAQEVVVVFSISTRLT